MTRLRLGPIEDDKPVKVTIEMPAHILRDLAEYARLHAEENNQGEAMPAERLIAPMIERFMGTDRGFARKRRSRGN